MLAAAPLLLADAPSPDPARGRLPAPVVEGIERVSGPSWLERRAARMGISEMGRAGKLGPAPTVREPHPSPHEVQLAGGEGVVVTGEDIYRLSCRACHAESGVGLPPQVRSLIGPTQSASAAFLTQRMKQRGMSIDPATARQAAKTALDAFLKRIESGGELMPSFPHLRHEEIDAVLGYVQQLGEVPGARPHALVEPRLREGELIVKGTCQICHAATGPGPKALQGKISTDVRPSLAGIAHDLTLDEVEAKVRRGMGSAYFGGRGTMPTFDYLTEDEVASAYLYLLAYPPVAGPGPPAAH